MGKMCIKSDTITYANEPPDWLCIDLDTATL